LAFSIGFVCCGLDGRPVKPRANWTSVEKKDGFFLSSLSMALGRFEDAGLYGILVIGFVLMKL
jgi:hypothetical protein